MNDGLRPIRVFIAVATRGSFSRAAEQVGLSQSATSLCVRQLEEQLELKLLDRTTRHVELTPIGEMFLQFARRLVQDFDGAMRQIKSIGASQSGRVSIACVPSVLNRLLPSCLSVARREYPDIAVNVADLPSVDVVRNVTLGEVDFGIASGALGTLELQVEALTDDPFCLVCQRTDPLAKVQTLKWQNLNGRTLVMLNNTSGSRRLIERALSESGADISISFELTHPNSVAGMVEAGMGIAVMPELAAPAPDHPILVTRILGEPEVNRTIALIRRRERSPSPAAEALWMLLHRMFGSPRH